MGEITRRRFLKQGMAGAGLAAISPSLLAYNVADDGNIIYRTLGNTGIKVPVISFGVMRADNPGLCSAAYEKGIRMFDTANGYQGGNNETMLGNVLAAYKRDSFILATKVKAETSRDGKPNDNTSADKFLELFNTSLSRLKMDYVDILYVHGVSSPELLEFKPLLKALQDLKKSGRIKFAGFSTHGNEPAMINAAVDLKGWDVILTQYNYRISYEKDLTQAIRRAADAGIGIVAMKTLSGGGWLDRERTKPMNTSAAIKWVLSNPGVATVIPGMTSFDQLDLNSKLLTDISLTEKDKSDLIADNAVPGLYCSKCGQCLPLCNRNLPIPDLMRAYMYTYGYSMPSIAKELLAETGTSADPCSGCDSCMVKCSRNFGVRQKISDVSRLMEVPSDFLV